MQWQEAFDIWLEATQAEGRSRYTLDSYRMQLASFRHWLGNAGISEVDEITPFHVRRFLLEYAQSHRPRSVKSVYGSLRTWMRWLVAEGILSTSPTDKVKAPSVPELSKKVYSPGELKVLIKYVERSRSPLALRDRALVSILADSGVRAGELLSVTLDDLEGDCILLRQTKGKRPRMVPLGGQAQRALWTYIQRGRPQLHPKDKAVFLNHAGQGMTRDALRSVLRRIGKALGFPVSAHRFRHTWATMMLRKGVDLETLRRMGGWTDYTMLKTYTHLDVEHLRQAQSKFSIVDNL